MEKRFKLLTIVLIVISLIYLALTNRYGIYSVGQGVVIKHDKWSGKTQMSLGLQGFRTIEDYQEQK